MLKWFFIWSNSRKLSRSEKPIDRVKAIKRLGQLGSKGTEEYLVGFLGDEDVQVRQAAAHVLRKFGTKGLDWALDAILRNRDDYIFELGRSENHLAEVALIRAIRRDPSVRSSAVTQLGQKRFLSSADVLIEVLGDDSFFVRSSAANSLAAMKAPGVALAITKAFYNEKVSHDAYEFSKVFKEIHCNKTIDIHIEALSDKDASIRERAVMALSQWCDDRAINALIQALEDANSTIVSLAACTLGKIGTRFAVQPLIKALSIKSINVRSSVAKALSQINCSEATEALYECIKNGDTCIIRNAEPEGLARIGKRAVPFLLNIFTHFDHCPNVVVALGYLKDPRAVERLIEILTRPGPYSQDDLAYQRAAAIALGRIGDPRAVEPLIREAKDGMSVIASGALEALKMINDPRTSGMLNYWQRMIEGQRGFGL